MTRICTQPFQVTGLDGTDARLHVPDVLLIDDDGTATVVDVKPAALVEKPRVRAQFEWTRRLCRDKGWRYEVFTGSDPILLRNIKLLALGRRPGRLPDEYLPEVRARLDEPETTLGNILARRPVTGDESLWHAAVFALAWSGEVTIDLRHPVNAETILQRTAEVMA